MQPIRLIVRVAVAATHQFRGAYPDPRPDDVD